MPTNILEKPQLPSEFVIRTTWSALEREPYHTMYWSETGWVEDINEALRWMYPMAVKFVDDKRGYRGGWTLAEVVPYEAEQVAKEYMVVTTNPMGDSLYWRGSRWDTRPDKAQPMTELEALEFIDRYAVLGGLFEHAYEVKMGSVQAKQANGSNLHMYKRVMVQMRRGERVEGLITGLGADVDGIIRYLVIEAAWNDRGIIGRCSREFVMKKDGVFRCKLDPQTFVQGI